MERQKSPEAPPRSPAMRFVLGALPGFAAGCILTVIAFNVIKNIASAATFKMLFSLTGAVLFVASAYAGARWKAWGWSGFLFGAGALLALYSLAAVVAG